jgi:hypothetical protein
MRSLRSRCLSRRNKPNIHQIYQNWSEVSRLQVKFIGQWYHVSVHLYDVVILEHLSIWICRLWVPWQRTHISYCEVQEKIYQPKRALTFVWADIGPFSSQSYIIVLRQLSRPWLTALPCSLFMSPSSQYLEEELDSELATFSSTNSLITLLDSPSHWLQTH